MPRLLSPLAAVTAAITARPRVAGGLASAGTGHLLRQCHRRRRRQDHAGDRPGPAAAGTRPDGAFPVARLWRQQSRHASRRIGRIRRTGGRRAAAARRDGADLDGRGPRRQCPCRRRGGRAGAGDGRRAAEPDAAQGPVAACGRRRHRVRQWPRPPGGSPARAGLRRRFPLPGRRADRSRPRRRPRVPAARPCRGCAPGSCTGRRWTRWLGRKVFAFAGIASPEKFFATLAAAGVVVAGRVSFRDHHPYTERELRAAADGGGAARRAAGHHRQGCGAPAARSGRAGVRGRHRHRLGGSCGDRGAAVAPVPGPGGAPGYSTVTDFARLRG